MTYEAISAKAAITIHEFDSVVVGAGGAGLFAALETSRVNRKTSGASPSSIRYAAIPARRKGASARRWAM